MYGETVKKERSFITKFTFINRPGEHLLSIHHCNICTCVTLQSQLRDPRS